MKEIKIRKENKITHSLWRKEIATDSFHSSYLWNLVSTDIYNLIINQYNLDYSQHVSGESVVKTSTSCFSETPPKPLLHTCTWACETSTDVHTLGRFRITTLPVERPFTSIFNNQKGVKNDKRT